MTTPTDDEGYELVEGTEPDGPCPNPADEHDDAHDHGEP